jgi:predicted alpha/beta superfamily hydrolase
VYTFLNAPDAFTRYIAASPSLFWDEHASFMQVAALAPRTARAPTRMFIGVSGLETRDKMGQDMIGDVRDFVSVLGQRHLPWLSLSTFVFPDDNHLSVIPGALMRGLREVGALG